MRNPQRHLVAAPRRPDRLLGDSDRRPRGELDRRAAALPGQPGPRQGHLPLHQQPWRLRSTAGMAIYDTMQHINADVATICVGQAAIDGRGAARGGHQGQAPCAQELAGPHPPAARRHSGARPPTSRSTRRRFCAGARCSTTILVQPHRPAPRPHLQADTERDHIMTAAHQALEYGLIDEVIRPGGEATQDED